MMNKNFMQKSVFQRSRGYGPKICSMDKSPQPHFSSLPFAFPLHFLPAGAAATINMLQQVIAAKAIDSSLVFLSSLVKIFISPSERVDFNENSKHIA